MTIRELNTPISDTISKILEVQGIKQSFIAEKIGVTRQEMNDMLNGRRIIKPCEIPKIADALGVDANCLFGIKEV